MIPLMFVMGVTAIKDGYEDYRRYKSDKEVNAKRVEVIRVSNGVKSLESTSWAKLVVGDVTVVRRDALIPADMLVIDTSGEHGVCYISSMNLDGETNLKLRRSVLPSTTLRHSHRFD